MSNISQPLSRIITLDNLPKEISFFRGVKLQTIIFA